MPLNPFETLLITLNGCAVPATPRMLACKTARFAVDGRCDYSFSLPKQTGRAVIEARFPALEAEGWDCGAESGERLALISFYKNKTKISLGTEGDLEGVGYHYLPSGLRLEVPPQYGGRTFHFTVAWLTSETLERDEIFTWLAADPASP